MNRRTALFAIAAAAIFPGFGAAAATDDENAVRRLFDSIRDAAGKADGKSLLAGLSTDALARLEAVRTAARR
ncbi:hypothetical protein JZU69_01865, partial [bacterium]|nr:hypothetical protein [bacterium]